MPRLRPLDRDELEAADRQHYDDIQRDRGADPSDRRMPLPDVYRILLHSPELASRVAATPMAIRAGSSVAQDVQEIVVLTVSRETMAEMQWDVHVLRARDAGVREAVIAGIRDHDVTGLDDRERLLVDFAARVHHRQMDDATHAAVVRTYGERVTVELTVLVAFTAMMIQIVASLHLPNEVGGDVALPAGSDDPAVLWSSAPALD